MATTVDFNQLLINFSSILFHFTCKLFMCFGYLNIVGVYVLATVFNASNSFDIKTGFALQTEVV